MSSYGNPQRIELAPTQTADLSFAFSAQWENLIEIFDQHNNLVVSRNNNAGDALEPATLTNNSEVLISYRVLGRHKTDGPNGDLPWLESAGRLLVDSETEYEIGFDDQLRVDRGDGSGHPMRRAGDPYYQNAKVTVRIR